LELQSQLEGTENRINVERNRYNEVATEYNIYVKKFPASLVANILNFDPLVLFEAAAGSEKAPTVDFN
jgi:LemA protein